MALTREQAKRDALKEAANETKAYQETTGNIGGPCRPMNDVERLEQLNGKLLAEIQELKGELLACYRTIHQRDQW